MSHARHVVIVSVPVTPGRVELLTYYPALTAGLEALYVVRVGAELGTVPVETLARAIWPEEEES